MNTKEYRYWADMQGKRETTHIRANRRLTEKITENK
jgi:hypothetical protein